MKLLKRQGRQWLPLENESFVIKKINDAAKCVEEHSRDLAGAVKLTMIDALTIEMLHRNRQQAKEETAIALAAAIQACHQKSNKKDIAVQS
jgi:hypothetical protein